MNDSKKEQLAIKTDHTETIEAVQSTTSGQLGEPLHPTTSVTWRKCWHVVSLIVLMPLGAIGVILYLLRSAFAEEFEGIGAALCAVACGGFLVWHLSHLFAEEDKLQDQQLSNHEVDNSSERGSQQSGARPMDFDPPGS